MEGQGGLAWLQGLLRLLRVTVLLTPSVFLLFNGISPLQDMRFELSTALESAQLTADQMELISQ